jgi:hypothetical protein
MQFMALLLTYGTVKPTAVCRRLEIDCLIKFNLDRLLGEPERQELRRLQPITLQFLGSNF